VVVAVAVVVGAVWCSSCRSCSVLTLKGME
jgi:hypothetical protein